MYDRLELRQRILEQLVRAGEPLGSGAILGRLHTVGMNVSQPTISRALNQTDSLGFTVKAANRGRVLTDSGRRYLEEVRRRVTTGQLTDGQLAKVGRATLVELRQALISRRVLEREAARLAAEHAQPEQVAQLWRVLDSQKQSMILGMNGADGAVAFHELLAEASGNRFLAAGLQLIRTSTHSIRSLMGALGASIGGDSYPRHLEILQAIAARDAAEAERLAGNHLNDFIRYIDGWISGGVATQGDESSRVREESQEAGSAASPC